MRVLSEEDRPPTNVRKFKERSIIVAVASLRVYPPPLHLRLLLAASIARHRHSYKNAVHFGC